MSLWILEYSHAVVMHMFSWLFPVNQKATAWVLGRYTWLEMYRCVAFVLYSGKLVGLQSVSDLLSIFVYGRKQVVGAFHTPHHSGGRQVCQVLCAVRDLTHVLSAGGVWTDFDVQCLICCWRDVGGDCRSFINTLIQLAWRQLCGCQWTTSW